MSTTFDRLCAILERDYNLDPGRLTLDAPLESLGIDSLGAVELLWSVEEVFRITLPAEPVELTTLDDVVRFIDGLVAAEGMRPVPAPTTASITAPTLRAS